MTRYINKADVVAEIERLSEEEYPCDTFEESTGYYNALDEVSSFIDTLEVKDVDEIIKNAEDHAYFAGSENTREKLINEACKWWEVELTYPSKVDADIFQLHGLWKCSISIGEEYYETDPYKDKECAIAELKGWWDGTKIKVEQFLKSVENENSL